VVPAKVTIRAFPGFDPLLSGDRLMQDMIEPPLEALTSPREIGMLALFLGEAFLVSVERLFRVARIDFMVDGPSGFTDYLREFRILIGDHRPDFLVIFPWADDPSYRFDFHAVVASPVIPLPSMAASFDNLEVNHAS
jgi:hypothetical protein